MKKIILLLLWPLMMAHVAAQNNDGASEASLLLDLKKAKAGYDAASQKYDNDLKLFNEKAVSLNDLNKSKNELLSREVDYQKLILQLISQQSYITIDRAVKYQSQGGEKRVKISLKSALEGNSDYLQQFSDHNDVFTPEMKAGKVFNIYVSIVDIESQTIIGSPYEYRIASIALGGEGSADFELLKDVENLRVELSYNNRKDGKNIYLKKDASVNSLDLASLQFSQEADLNSQTDYGLVVERFSNSDEAYRMMVLGLPRQITSEFYDDQSKVSQIRFAQGVNTRNLSLRVYLPDRTDEEVVIDQPIQFFVVALTNEQFNHLQSNPVANPDAASLEPLCSGIETLELIPRGKGKIEVTTTSLYYEIDSDEQVTMTARVKNAGSRRLDNIKLSTENPMGWTSVIEPDLIRSLEPGQETTVSIAINPPVNGGVGAQEIKLKTESVADNRKVSSEDKTIRVQVNAPASLGGTIALVLLLGGIVGGIVWFGIKLSRR